MVFNMVSLGQNVKTGLYLLHYILIVYLHYFSIVLEKENKVSLCIVCIHHEDCSEFPQKFNNLHCRCCSYFVTFIFGNFCNNYWINNDCGYELDYSRCNMCRNVAYLYFEVSKSATHNFI